MTQLWTIVDSSGEVVQACCATPDPDTPPSECGEPWEAGYQAIPIDEPPDLHRYAWVDGAWTLIPEVAHAMKWEEAKAYRAQRQAEPMPIAGVLPGVTILADGRPEGRAFAEWIARGAESALRRGEDVEVSFKAFDNERHTINAEQTVLLANMMLVAFTTFHAKCEAIRDALDAALASGATAEEILAIDITADYP